MIVCVKGKINELEAKVHDLLEEIKELKEDQKDNMTSKPKRKRVEEDEDYYYIDDGYKFNVSSEWNDETDNNRFMYHNYFVNEKDAKKYLRVLNTEMKLRQLAEELNNGEKIDWESGIQTKCHLYYDCKENQIYGIIAADSDKEARVIYCLDEDFRDRALSEIGKELLKEYLTYEF